MPAESLAPRSLREAEHKLPAGDGAQRRASSFGATIRSVRSAAASPLFLLLLATFAVRIVGIERPLVGTFATKSAVHAMEARNWAEGRAPIWQPTIDLLHDGARSWHLMEWPAAAYAAALGHRFVGGSIDVWGRGIAIACSLVSVWLVYRLAGRWFGPRAAQGAACVFAFSPVSIIYGQSFLLEASLAALFLTTIAAIDRWLDTGPLDTGPLDTGRLGYLAVAAVACCLAVLTKIYMLLLIVPLGTMWYFDASRRAAATKTPLFLALLRGSLLPALFFGVGLLPMFIWYSWVLEVSPHEGPAADYHPLGRATIHGFPHPLLFSLSYYSRLAADFATVVLTPLGLLLAGLGLCDARLRRHMPLILALGTLLVVFPLKFMAANYYYLVLLPGLALAAGLGWQWLCEKNVIGMRARQVLVAVSLLIALRYAVGPAYRTHPEDRGVIAAAAAVRSATIVEEPVATMHGSTLDLLYYCDRPGWAFDVADADLAEKLHAAHRDGARKFIVAGFDSVARHPATSELLKRLPLEQSGDDWRLYSLDALSKR